MVPMCCLTSDTRKLRFSSATVVFDIFLEEDGKGVSRLAIRRPDGSLTEDQRKPFFVLPDFVSVPFGIKKQVDARINPSDEFELLSLLFNFGKPAFQQCGWGFIVGLISRLVARLWPKRLGRMLAILLPIAMRCYA